MTQRIALVSGGEYRVRHLVVGAISAGLAALCALASVNPAWAQQKSDRSADEIVYDTPAAIEKAFQDARKLSADGKHYAAAAIFFNIYTADTEQRFNALGYLTESLIQAGYSNAASYFYIKTLQSGNRAAIRRVLPHLPEMIDEVGGDLLRKYIVRHTSEADYDQAARNHFFYFMGKDELLKGDPAKALQFLAKVTSGSGILAQSAYLRGVAYAQLGQVQNSISSFSSCRRMADNAESRSKSMRQEYFDLEARCTAGLARAHYQAGSHDIAEETYDDIPKASFVWTDILFEQAWNAYAKNDFNRALGKLVTYRSPALSFVFNPEVDVLRAQSFLSLCLYDDVNKVVNEFNSRYAGVGGRMKDFLLSNERDLSRFYALARQTLSRKLHTKDELDRALNRFIRGPYFASLVAQERATRAELRRARDQKGSRSFNAFLDKVLQWRIKSVQLLGGAFVKNSMYDLYQDLLADLDRMSFIKLEMLKHAKTQLEKTQQMSADEDGVLKRGKPEIDRKDYQYFWSFNGEFWVDEMGDYVFALESQCGA